jgi:hypothetical protein
VQGFLDLLGRDLDFVPRRQFLDRRNAPGNRLANLVLDAPLVFA